MTIIPKTIKRERYIEALKPYINKPIIKVITGQRRVGKSYLLYQLMDEIKLTDKTANNIYINKEYHEFDDIYDHKDLVKFIEQKLHKSRRNYLFIDEIQEIRDFEKALSNYQSKDNLDIYITGSNAEMLSTEISTKLSGRYIEKEIYSLSYNEFINFHKLDNTEETFSKYIRFGGLPGLINFKLEEFYVYDYLKNIYATILYKDIVKKHNIRNVQFLERLVLFLANNTGSIVSAKKICDFLKSQKVSVSPNLVLDYLKYLTDAFFVFKVNRYDIEGKRVLEIGDKYYFEDLGLRHTVSGYKANDINKILENIAYLHLLIAGYNITVGWQSGKEIDFICEKDGKKLYVQVAYLLHDEKAINREFGNLELVQDNYPKIVVSLDKVIGDDYNGIQHKNFRDFISDII